MSKLDENQIVITRVNGYDEEVVMEERLDNNVYSMIFNI